MKKENDAKSFVGGKVRENGKGLSDGRVEGGNPFSGWARARIKVNTDVFSLVLLLLGWECARGPVEGKICGIDGNYTQINAFLSGTISLVESTVPCVKLDNLEVKPHCGKLGGKPNWRLLLTR